MAISFGKPKGFNPQLSAIAIFILPVLICIVGKILGMTLVYTQATEEMVLLTSVRTLLTANVISAWLSVVVLSLTVCKWQSGIQTYCRKMQLEKSKISGWEIFWVVLGMLGQHTLFLSTYLCIISWQNINNILPFFLSALQ